MIKYEDNEIAVAIKPYGVSSQLSSGENMVTLLSQALNCEIYPVHRLDTTTTGLMVFAKNEKSAGFLSAEIASRGFTKEYLAVCHGALPENGEMVDFLYHDRIQNKSFVAKSKRKGAKEAKLEFYTQGTVFFDNKELSIVKIHLLTGRTHQIRVQLASRGYPLYADGKYGAKDNGKIALHSAYLSFTHPTTGQRMEFTSEPTGGIWDLLSKKA